MTDEQIIQTAVEEVLAALKTSGKTISQLTEVSELSENDYFEISGGRKVSYAVLLTVVTATIEAVRDDLVNLVAGSVLTTLSASAGADSVTVTAKENGYNAVSVQLPAATQQAAGVLTAADKKKYDDYDTRLKEQERKVVDDRLNYQSTNPVQNAVITRALQAADDSIDAAVELIQHKNNAVSVVTPYTGTDTPSSPEEDDWWWNGTVLRLYAVGSWSNAPVTGVGNILFLVNGTICRYVPVSSHAGRMVSVVDEIAGGKGYLDAAVGLLKTQAGVIIPYTTAPADPKAGDYYWTGTMLMVWDGASFMPVTGTPDCLFLIDGKLRRVTQASNQQGGYQVTFGCYDEMVTLTQAQYDELVDRELIDNDTYYCILEED